MGPCLRKPHARATPSAAGAAAPRLEADDAIVLGDQLSKLWWREPLRREPLQIRVGRPTGDGAALSDEDGDLIVHELPEELADGRDADALDALGLRL